MSMSRKRTKEELPNTTCITCNVCYRGPWNLDDVLHAWPILEGSKRKKSSHLCISIVVLVLLMQLCVYRTTLVLLYCNITNAMHNVIYFYNLW